MRYIIVFFLIHISFLSFSQEISFGLQTGWGTYKMNELKRFNNHIASNLPFDSRITHSFPSYLYYQPVLKITKRKVNIGILYSLNSTGSRISAMDYSAEYRFDLKIKSNTVGMIFEFKPIPEKKSRPGLSIFSELGHIITNVEIFEFFNVFETELTKSRYFFHAKNYYFEPGINFLYKCNYLLFEINLSYFKQFGENQLINNDNSKLLNSLGQGIKPEWDGFRYACSIFLSIPYE